MSKRVATPFPYQGSKRLLANSILEHIPSKVSRFFEPFAGSAAIALAIASDQPETEIFLNDINEPLANLWRRIIETPESLAGNYEKLWQDQHGDPKAFYNKVRNRFNVEKDPADFLYLLARCVKGAIRYNSVGEFNQSPDNRRLGTKPEKMRIQLQDTSDLLKGRTLVSSLDYRKALTTANSNDLVYLDPPYQGVSTNRDSRYLSGLSFDEFVESLRNLILKDVPLIISYDGKTGEKIYGKILPDELDLEHFYLNAGKSTSSTLHGKSEITYESLYISKSLINSGLRQNLLFQ
jgi:DNA adenine methylase